MRKIKEFESKINVLEQVVITLSKQLEEVNTQLKAVKELGSVKKKSEEIAKKQKWLNGYPDETVRDEDGR